MLRRTIRFSRAPVSAFLQEPSKRKTFQETLAHCESNGIDMASSLSSDFALLQSKLLKYRVVRLCDELNFVRHNPMSSFPTFKNFVVQITLLTLLFLTFRNFGRMSMWPLDEPPKS